MKKVLLIFALVIVTSCTQKPQTTQQVGDPITPTEEQKAEKIELVYSSQHYYYEIIKVDGHLYLCNQKGGIVHMESCPCKTNLGRIQ